MTAREALRVRRCFWLPAALVTTVGALSIPYASGDIADPVLTLYAENGSGTSNSLVVPYEEAYWDPGTQTYTWSLASPVDLLDGSTFIGRLENATLVINAGVTPEISLMLDVFAGTSWTDFYADTAVVGFPTIPADLAAGRISASGEVWDFSEPANEVWMVGLTPNFGCFEGCYNGGSVFAEVLGVVGMPSGGSGHATGGESQPGAGYAPINEAVDDFTLHTAFQLSPDDHAITQSSYGLIPEPAVLVLVAVGAALVGRRCRG